MLPTNHQPPTLRGDARSDARLLEGRLAIATAKRSASREWSASALVNHQPPTTNHAPTN
ncbi:MAG: hypothetical protein ACHBN1_08025 [Heteroscytonema crispum UTEX LB 1556]